MAEPRAVTGMQRETFHARLMPALVVLGAALTFTMMQRWPVFLGFVSFCLVVSLLVPGRLAFSARRFLMLGAAALTGTLLFANATADPIHHSMPGNVIETSFNIAFDSTLVCEPRIILRTTLELATSE